MGKMGMGIMGGPQSVSGVFGGNEHTTRISPRYVKTYLQAKSTLSLAFSFLMNGGFFPLLVKLIHLVMLGVEV